MKIFSWGFRFVFEINITSTRQSCTCLLSTKHCFPMPFALNPTTLSGPWILVAIEIHKLYDYFSYEHYSFSCDTEPLSSVIICCLAVATLNTHIHRGTASIRRHGWLGLLFCRLSHCFLFAHSFRLTLTLCRQLSQCCLLTHSFRRLQLDLLKLQLRIFAHCCRERNCWGCVPWREDSSNCTLCRQSPLYHPAE